MNDFLSLFKEKKVLIGVVHLTGLPGYPSYKNMESIYEEAKNGLKLLEKAGFDGVIFENSEDPGFIIAPPRVVGAFKFIMNKLVKIAKIPVGIEIIYDMEATVKVAATTKTEFVRLDVFADTVKTRWGIVRKSYEKVNKILYKSAHQPLLLTDVHVKHAELISKATLENSIVRSIEYGSRGIIITGALTGVQPNLKDLNIAKILLGNNAPVIIGSGLNLENAKNMLSTADAAIVGTSIKTKGKLDFNKAKKLVRMVKGVRNH